ncbi:MAG: 3-oxoacyl-[acyl-carrier-protein] synthase III [Candidatus Magnetoglobus multicellularis str. Araruama]|uniref:3-oxoacyl-[acyl-carrier-protein] synthase III n=1 Tax=Candidatus Magnetoglobus multicellularis str. Araruama TaxID=890399 RepID=A0A1V1P4B2_9BACT|nr:MAG: 3-oxoacyl-[acyl-carrier-protein] synthase III [Candidatus Magnetoglobus multicellularis str. Araruama]
MAYEAAIKALEQANLSADDIDFIIYATLSPDHYFPGNGCLLQDRLFGGRPVGALDVRNQCTGFLYSLAMADSLIKSGQYTNILVVGSEVHSRGLDFSKDGRAVTVLFGDGAGAAVVAPAKDNHLGFLGHAMYSEGKHADALWLEYPCNAYDFFISHDDLDAGHQYPKMNGRLVFKHATRRMVEVSKEVLDKAGKSVDDIDVVLFHQANLRINQMTASMLKIPEEKLVNTIQWTGNTTAATIPICMCEALRQKKMKENDLVLLCGFGAGFTWAASLLYW